MHPPTPTDLLTVWEQGLSQTLVQKSIKLLQVCSTSVSVAEVASWSIGERDARLLQLREWLFGTQLVNMAHCPACNETVEWENITTDLFLQSPTDEIEGKILRLQTSDFTIHYRLPNSLDLQQIVNDPVGQSNPNQLLRLCVQHVEQAGQPIQVSQLPESVWEALNKQMAQDDPQADISMAITCPVCRHSWEVRFDIVSYLWQEIDQWARLLLREVFLLARTLGWSEQAILQLSPQRRQFYLEMIQK